MERTGENEEARRGEGDPFGRAPWAGAGVPPDEPATEADATEAEAPAEAETQPEPAEAETQPEPAEAETQPEGSESTDAEAPTGDEARSEVAGPPPPAEPPPPREPAFTPEPPAGLLDRRPEILVGAAAAGGFVLAQILRRFGDG